jgi:thiamine biosynthesis lipoprotein
MQKFSLFFFLFLFFLFVFIWHKYYYVKEFEFFKIGPLNTVFRIKLFAQSGVKKQNIEKFINSLVKKLNAEEKIFNYFPISTLAFLNQKREISAKESGFIQLKEVLQKSLSLFRNSHGYFSSYLGRISEIWGFLTPQSKDNRYQIPSQKVLSALSEDAKKSKVIIRNNKIILQGKANIDLGGIAKGYIVEKLYKKLREFPGIVGGIIDVGGDLVVFGKKSLLSKEGFKVAIASPWGGIFKILSLCAGKKWAIATSGDYERFFEKRGKRYFHLLNPDTGYPAFGSIRSVTVIANSLDVADGLATAIFVGGKEIISDLQKHYRFHYYNILKDKKVITDWKEK